LDETRKALGERLDYQLDTQVGYLLRLASQRHAVIFQKQMVAGLTPMQFSTLLRVAEEGEVSQNQLGRLAAMDVATIKGVVDRLRARSTPDLDDKRRSLISLTEQGREMIVKLEQVGMSITDTTLSPLKASEQATLIRLLKKIS